MYSCLVELDLYAVFSLKPDLRVLQMEAIVMTENQVLLGALVRRTDALMMSVVLVQTLVTFLRAVFSLIYTGSSGRIPHLMAEHLILLLHFVICCRQHETPSVV
jgi:hypothetical protein